MKAVRTFIGDQIKSLYSQKYSWWFVDKTRTQ